jgi:hypothetical protein
MGKLFSHHNQEREPMNLSEIFCPNIACPARGQGGRGNIRVHSEVEKRCYCNVCKKSFSINKGTIFYRLKTDPVQVMLVVTLLANGCPYRRWWPPLVLMSERLRRGGSEPVNIANRCISMW